MSASELVKLKITLNPDGGTDEREYTMYPIENVDVQSRKDAFSISPPGLSAAENILLGVSGMQANITITAKAWNDGVDRADGTHTETVTTVQEQLTYLEDEIHAPDFSASWVLDHVGGNAFVGDEVFVESVDYTPFSVDSPKWKPFSLRLRRGESI